jgi:hypothetical protein
MYISESSPANPGDHDMVARRHINRKGTKSRRLTADQIRGMLLELARTLCQTKPVLRLVK